MKTQIQKDHTTKVLVVDDEREIRDLLSGFLEEAGFLVTLAKNGTEALTRAKEFLPDVILLDIILPDLDGISVYESLRQSKTMSHIPVLFFSALSNSMPKHLSREKGLAPYSFIPKPVSAGLLMSEIRKLIGGHD